MTLFSEAFANQAGNPLLLSREALNDSRMGEGVRRLERTHLESALQAGVKATAILVGVPESQVAGLLPQEELQGALERLQKRQERAVVALQRQDMTIATFVMPSQLPTAPSVSEQLTSLATVFARDKEIASKFRDLAFEVATWEALLKRCTSVIESDEKLQQSFRRKRWLRGLVTWGGLGLVGVGIAAAALLFVLKTQREKQEAERIAQEQAKIEVLKKKITTVLALPNPCTPEDFTEEQRKQLSEEQTTQLADRQRHCKEIQQKKIREQRCEELIAHLDAGQFTEEDTKTAGAAATTLQRIVKQPLLAADLNFPAETAPCQETSAGPKFWTYLARKAAAGGPNLWGLSEGISSHLLEPLATPGVLHPSTVLAIAFRAEKLATAALKTGREEDRKKAHSLCGLKVKLGQALALSCQKILKLRIVILHQTQRSPGLLRGRHA